MRDLLPCFTLAASLALSAMGCGATFDAHTRSIRSGGAAFRVGPLPPEWTKAGLGGDRIAFHHRRGGAISAGATCSHSDDVALEVLTNHLLIGFAERQIRTQAKQTIDGRAALVTAATAELDGVPIAIELFVLVEDGCLFDLQLVGSPSSLASRRTDFRSFLQPFRVVATP
jgi:hypothetical protein